MLTKLRRFHPAPQTTVSILASTPILVLGLTLLPAGSAHAGGMYLSGGLGVNLATDSDVSGTGIDTSIDFDPGPVAMIAAGYAFDNGFRGELELAGRWNDAETVGSTSGSGDTSAISGMVNMLYDFNGDGGITPYVGGGLGMARIDDSGISSVNGSSISDDDTVFAYQAMAGVSYDLGNLWSLTADYRYFVSDDVSLTTASNVAVDQEYASHSLLLGIRFNLSGSNGVMPAASATESVPVTNSETSLIAEQAPPDTGTSMEPDSANDTDTVTGEAAGEAESGMTQMATAPAATGIPRAYRILFDWDKSILNPLALNTIAAIAMNAGKGEIIQIRATGHADRSGPEIYNEDLSQKRAEEVQKALIKLGIPVGNIVIDWRGEREPAVQTDDGVRNQDNRRVEIIFPAN